MNLHCFSFEVIALIISLCANFVFGSSGKRGLPFNDPSTYIQHWENSSSQVTWAYNWDSSTDGNFPPYLEYVPMLWGDQSMHTQNWAANVLTAQSRGSKYLLAFNEPDGCRDGGSCMSVDAAVAAYRKYMMPYASSMYLGAPAVTNGGRGKLWLMKFLARCTGCQVDFVPIHWYDSATNVAYFKKYMADMQKVAGKRSLWITEFNGRGTPDEQTTFLQTILPWMDSQPKIQRYAWHWCDPNFNGGSLVLSNGFPSPLGQVYKNTSS